MVLADQQALGRIPYVFALALSGGSLLTYALGALVSRFLQQGEERTVRSFNLGLPSNTDISGTFAISLVAAQSTLSTVFVAFLTDGGSYGIHLLYCPIAMAGGYWLMLRVYERVSALGYIDDSAMSGLIPDYMFKFTDNRFITRLYTVLCFLPLLALLAAELYFGIRLLDYLGDGAYRGVVSSQQFSQPTGPISLSILLFFVFMSLLLGYVFLGGFRAVITSDIWQFRIMFATYFLALAGVIPALIRERATLQWRRPEIPHASGASLFLFYVTITLLNCLQPLSMATTWQRFRAFRVKNPDFRRSIKLAMIFIICLWVPLILLGMGVSASPKDSIKEGFAFLNAVLRLSTWCSLFVFPLLIMAGFSGMYSCADTCVSALLYLTESSEIEKGSDTGEIPLRRHHYWAMIAIVLGAAVMYAVVENFNLKSEVLTIRIFGSAIICAPSLLLLAMKGPQRSNEMARVRSRHVGASIAVGYSLYALLLAGGVHPGVGHNNIWALWAALTTWALPVALIGSAIPVALLVWAESGTSRPNGDTA